MCPARRHIIDSNLARTASDRSARERRRLCRATFKALGRSTVDFLRLPLMSADELMGLVVFEGKAHLDMALAQGRGAIIVSGHIGAWELCGPLVAAHGYRMSGYVEDGAIDPAILQAYERYRGATGLTLIRLTDGARAGSRVLKRGEVLGLLADRVIEGRGLRTAFAGGTREIPMGPAILARWTGAPILFGTLLPTPGKPHAYRATLEPLGVGADEDDTMVTRVIATRLAEVVANHPDQWFVFRPNWLSDSP
jgi:KDO2-lipid IV(A) lauroyltransferase